MTVEDTFALRGIPYNLIEHFWQFAEPYVKRALDHTNGEFSAIDFKKACIKKDMQLWLVSKGSRVVGAITTELICYPNRRHCRVATLAGTEFKEWINLADDTIEKWSAEQGCNAVEAYVRKGFTKKLIEHGYKHKYSVMVKKINSRE